MSLMVPSFKPAAPLAASAIPLDNASHPMWIAEANIEFSAVSIPAGR